MSWLSDASDTATSWFSDTPEPAPPAPVYEEAAPAYVGTGGGSGAAIAAAYGHYTEEDALADATGMLTPEQIESITAATAASVAGGALPTGLMTPEEIDAANIAAATGGMSDEERARVCAAYEQSTSDTMPTGLLTPEQIDELNAKAAISAMSDEEQARVRAAYDQTESEALPTGLLMPEQLEMVAPTVGIEPTHTTGSIETMHASAPPPTGLMHPAQIDEVNALDGASDEEAIADSVEGISEEERALMVGAIGEKPVVQSEEDRLKEVMASGDPAAAAKASVEFMNLKLADAKAAELLDVAKGVQEGGEYGFGLDALGMGDKTDQMEDKLSGLTPEMREKVLAKLGTMGGEDGLPEGALEDARAAADRVTESEAADKRREKRLDDTVADAEAAAASGKGGALAKSLDGLSERQREKALEKMSDEGRAAAEKELEKRREKLELIAERLEKAQHGTSATDCTDEVGILTNLSGLTPNEAEELQEIYGEKYKDGDGKARKLKADLKAEFGKDDKEAKFVTAVLDGDEDAADLSVELTVSYMENEAEAWVNSDEDAMNDLLRAHSRDKATADRIVEAYKNKTGKDLSAACEAVMDPAQFKEASANMEADTRTANVAVLEQGDGERTQRVVEEVELEDGGIEQLAADTQAHTGKKLGEVLDGQLEPDTAKAVEAKVETAEENIKTERDAKRAEALDALKKDPKKFEEANIKAEQIASKLSTELSKMHVVGNNTEVTDHLRGLSPAEVALVMQHYKTSAESLGKEDVDLEADLRAKLTGKDLKVADAVMSGNKVLAAVAFVEQAADHDGTNVDGWKKAMETLETEEERIEFKKMMGKHIGGGEAAYDKLVKSETTSFERDELLAQGIANEDERKATLAQVDISKNAYGGKVAGWKESLGDLGGDIRGETDEERAKRRQQMRETDIIMMASNFGGSEDAMLDAAASLENEEQVRIFNQKMLEQNGETAAETFDSEMSDHHASSGKKYAANDFEGAQAERMVAELDNYVDDREDAASKPFEQVRLSDDAKKRLSEVPEGKAREEAIEAEKKLARESLLAKADEAAKAAGHESYLAMLEKELSPAQLAAAKDRIELGKVSDHNALFAAGDTAVGNLGKDANKFYEVMENKTPAEMEKLEADFEAAHPDLEFKDWVRSKATSAGQKRDFEVMLEGNYARMSPEELAAKAKDDPQALIKRVKDLGEAARGGADENEYDPLGNLKRKVGNELGNDLADSIGNAGERLDGRLAAVKKLEDKINGGEALTDEETSELITHMRYMSGDQKAYTETKTSAVNSGAEVIGTVVEYGTTAMTGNSTLGTAAGGLAKMEVKGTFDPGRYGLDEQVGDGVGVLADTLGSAVGGKMKNPYLGALVEGAMGGAGSQLGNTQNWNDAGKLATSTGTAALEQGVSAVVSAGLETGIGDNVAGKLASATAEQLITGDPNATFGDQLLEIGKSAAQDYASGKAEEIGKKRNAPSTGADAKPASTDDGPDIEARDATDAERAEVDAALAEESAADNGVDVKRVIDVEGSNEPVDSGVDVKRVIDVEGSNEPVDSGVDVKRVIDVEGSNEPVDSGVDVTRVIDVEGSNEPVDSGVDVKREVEGSNEPVVDDGPATPAHETPSHDTAPAKVDAPKTLADLQAQLPERRAADADGLAAAKGKLAEGKSLEPTEMQAVLDLVVEASRAGLEKDFGIDVGDHASLGGACGPTQQRVAQMLTHILGPGATVNMHASHPTDPTSFSQAAVDGSKLQSRDSGHYFTTVHTSDGRVFLIDPTFGQFAVGESARVGERLLGQEGGGAAGAGLMKNGFVELTPEVADAYGRAITGKDEKFTPEDFATSNRTPGGHGGTVGKRDAAVGDAKKAWDDVEATSPVVESAPAPVVDRDPETPTSEVTELSLVEEEQIRRLADASTEDRVDLDALIQANEDPRLRPVDLAAMAAKDREDRKNAPPEIDAWDPSDQARREAEHAAAVHEDAAEIEHAEIDEAGLREVDAALAGEAVWDARRWVADLLRPAKAKKANELGGGVVDHLSNEKMNPAATPELEAMKTTTDVTTTAIGALDVIANLIDPASTSDAIDRKALGNAAVTVVTKSLEVVLEKTVPGLGPVFGKTVDMIKQHLDATSSTTIEAFGDVLVRLGKRDFAGALKVMRGMVTEAAALPSESTHAADADAPPEPITRLRVATEPTTEATTDTHSDAQAVDEMLASEEALQALSEEDRRELKRWFR